MVIQFNPKILGNFLGEKERDKKERGIREGDR